MSTLSPSSPENNFPDLELAPGRSTISRTGCRGIAGPVPPPLLMELIAHLMGSRLARQQISIAMRMFDPFPSMGRMGHMGHMDLRLRLEKSAAAELPAKWGQETTL